jgi:hypothetical protein
MFRAADLYSIKESLASLIRVLSSKKKLFFYNPCAEFLHSAPVLWNLLISTINWKLINANKERSQRATRLSVDRRRKDDDST